MPRIFTMFYSIVCYALGVAALVYLICFIGDLFVSVTINKPSAYAPELATPFAVIWNLILIAAWGAQHTVMASKSFKAKWNKLVPPAIERSTYLLFVTAMTAVLVLLWAPIPAQIWNFSGSLLGGVLMATYFLGWGVVLLSSFMINHFHLFGLQQAYNHITKIESKSATFKTPFFYQFVRHPMMTGVLIALWSAPEMTVGRLVMNLAMTAYVIIGVRYEEKTLVADLGDKYLAYQNSTPSLIPRLKGTNIESDSSST